MPQQMAILLDFIKVNRLRLVDWFFRFDKDHSGDISREEFKIGLKETGLKMTQVGGYLATLSQKRNYIWKHFFREVTKHELNIRECFTDVRTFRLILNTPKAK
jgi:hypothetical protein